VEVLARAGAPSDGRQDGTAAVAELVLGLNDDVGDDVREEAIRLVERQPLARTADRQVDVAEAPAVVGGPEEAGARGRVDDSRVSRVDGELEALRTGRHSLRPPPVAPAVGCPEDPEPAVGVAAEG